MDSTIVYIILGVLLLGVLAWTFIGGNKRRWYKVYLANNDVVLLYRDGRERWWRTSDRYLRFKNELGEEITFPSAAHWILMWESVADKDLDLARREIDRIRKAKVSEEA